MRTSAATATRKVSGDVDVKQVVKDVLEALRSPALRSQLESQGQTVPQIPELDDDTIDKVADAIEELRFEVNVDERRHRPPAVRRGRVRRARRHRRRRPGGRQGVVHYLLKKVGIDPDDRRRRPNPQPLGALLRQLGLGTGQALPEQQ